MITKLEEIRAKRIRCPECSLAPETHHSPEDIVVMDINVCSFTPRECYQKIYAILNQLEDTSDVVHNHTEAGRRSPCPACHLRLPDVENEDAPPGCSYEFQDNPIDGDYVCRRHGFVTKSITLYQKFQEAAELYHDPHKAVEEFFSTYTGPCLAIIKE